MLPHPANFVFLVEMGFLHVGQAALELLTSSDLPASASRSAEITDVSHYFQASFFNFNTALQTQLTCFQKDFKVCCLWDETETPRLGLSASSIAWPQA